MSRLYAYIFDYVYVLPIFRPAMHDFFRAVIGEYINDLNMYNDLNRRGYIRLARYDVYAEAMSVRLRGYVGERVAEWLKCK